MCAAIPKFLCSFKSAIKGLFFILNGPIFRGAKLMILVIERLILEFFFQQKNLPVDTERFRLFLKAKKPVLYFRITS